MVFDIQGTLIHKDDVLSVSLKNVLARHGMDMPDDRAMRLYRVLSPYVFVKEYYGLAPDEAETLAHEIRAEQDALYESRATAYEGAADVLRTLRGLGLKLYAAAYWPVAESALWG